MIARPESIPEPPPLARLAAPTDDWVLFLDFDGTLVDLASTPDAISVPGQLPRLLETVARRFGGAVVLVTGRALADLDRHLGGLSLPAAGQHGAEYRFGDGREAPARPAAAMASARKQVQAFAREHPGVLVEDKGAALALHYRASPELGIALGELAASIVEASGGGLDMTPGKSVVEIRPAGADKGAAVEFFLRDGLFGGRRPLAVGDDVTDEAAFAAALAARGSAVKVGEGETTAPWRLPAPSAVRRWLCDAV